MWESRAGDLPRRQRRSRRRWRRGTRPPRRRQGASGAPPASLSGVDDVVEWPAAAPPGPADGRRAGDSTVVNGDHLEGMLLPRPRVLDDGDRPALGRRRPRHGDVAPDAREDARHRYRRRCAAHSGPRRAPWPRPRDRGGRWGASRRSAALGRAPRCATRGRASVRRATGSWGRSARSGRSPRHSQGRPAQIRWSGPRRPRSARPRGAAASTASKRVWLTRVGRPRERLSWVSSESGRNRLHERSKAVISWRISRIAASSRWGGCTERTAEVPQTGKRVVPVAHGP